MRCWICKHLRDPNKMIVSFRAKAFRNICPTCWQKEKNGEGTD